MTEQPLKPEEDDGRVICSMDVEGMPWHDKRERRQRNAARLSAAGAPNGASMGEPMTRSETRRYIWNAVLAGLSIAAAFSLTWVLLILFCIHVWFR